MSEYLKDDMHVSKEISKQRGFIYPIANSLNADPQMNWSKTMSSKSPLPPGEDIKIGIC